MKLTLPGGLVENHLEQVDILDKLFSNLFCIDVSQLYGNLALATCTALQEFFSLCLMKDSTCLITHKPTLHSHRAQYCQVRQAVFVQNDQ